MFGPYGVVHQVGSGVLGPVYRARRSDRGTADRGRLFALKTFHVDLTPEQTVVFGEALQEIVGAGVAHAAVVSPVGAGVADGVPYLACEYVEAESLDVRMRPRAALAAGIALPFVVQIAEALDAAHGQGLAHGALHPRDVLVTAETARVGGFGIVAALDRVGHRGPLRPPYAAPERMAGGDWGAAADRYALAAVAWELLTGRRAAPAGGRMAADLERVLDADAAPRLLPVFEAAFAADPDRRPSSAGRFADALAGASGWTGAAGVREALAGGGEAGESGDGRAPERGVGDPAVAAGGAALPVAAAGGTVMPRRRKQPEADWSKQSLDFGRPGEPPRAGGPRAGDAPPAVDDGDAPSAPAGSGVEPFADGGGGAAAGGDPGEAAADPDADGYAPIAVGDLESRVEGGGVHPDEVEPGPDYDRGDVEVEPGPDYDRGDVEVGPGPDYGPGDAADEARHGRPDYGPGDAADEARHGRPDYGPGDAADEARHGRPDYGPGDAADEALGGVEPEHGALAPEAPGTQETGRVDDDDGFALAPEDAYEYGIDEESGSEEPAGEIFSSGPADQARRLPIALVAVIGVAVAVTAFVIGLGWMGREEGGPAPGDAEPSSAADEVRAFSEAVVGAPASGPGADEGENAVPARDTPSAAPPDAPPPPAPAPDPPPPAPAPPAVRDIPPAAPAPRPSPPAASEPEPPRPAPSAEAAPPPVGRLLVRSSPPGAEVVVNGEPQDDTTPLALADLPYGRYDVEVTLAGYGSRRAQLVLDEDDPIGRFNVDLTAAPAEPR